MARQRKLKKGFLVEKEEKKTFLFCCLLNFYYGHALCEADEVVLWGGNSCRF